jgi:DNA-binding winged helix-turn-helix (wHTH) protein
MQLPTLEVTVVAACFDEFEARLVESLRREGIHVTEQVADSWLRQLPTAETIYVWCPSTPLTDDALARVTAWLEPLAIRPGLLAIGEAGDVEALLAAGLDDAVPRSISERELLARVRALHRRMTRQPREGHLRYGALTIDTIERSAWVNGVVVSITPIEQAVLVALIRARGRALTRLALLDSAWGDSDFEISERAVDNVVLRLRRKLPHPEVIETVRGVGFRLANPNETHPSPGHREPTPNPNEPDDPVPRSCDAP